MNLNEPQPLDIYLNDHLAGSVGAVEVAKRLISENGNNELGQFVGQLLADIEEDQRTVEGLMDALGTSRNPIKQAGAWFGEKLSRIKFGTEQIELSTLLSLEALVMGVEGKRSLWAALRKVSDSHEPLSGMDFDALIARAEDQKERLEQRRLEMAREALGTRAPV